MKKVLLMFALFTSLCLFSCKDAATTTTENGDTTKTETVEKKVDINELAAKAKAEGANWSVDEWKAQFRNVAIAIKPMAVDMDAFVKKYVNGDVKDLKTEDLEKEGKALEEKYADLNKLLDEFNAIAEGTVNGKAVADDKAWGEALFKELGIPELK